MPKLSSLLISGLVLGFLAGWLVNHQKSLAAKRTHVIAVFGFPDENGDPNVGPERATLHRDDGEQASWYSSSPKKRARIEFGKEVFEGMTQDTVSRRWRVPCDNRQCDSGKIKIGYGEYEYWQILQDPDGNNRKEKDGWIIVTR
jgi:hypothetical protein